jgi:hypothetical protein
VIPQSKHEGKMVHGISDDQEADSRVRSKIDFHKTSSDGGHVPRILEWVGCLLSQELPRVRLHDVRDEIAGLELDRLL